MADLFEINGIVFAFYQARAGSIQGGKLVPRGVLVVMFPGSVDEVYLPPQSIDITLNSETATDLLAWLESIAAKMREAESK